MARQKNGGARRPKKFVEELDVELNDNEKYQLGIKLAELDAQLVKVSEEKKRIVGELKTKIDGLELERRRAYEAINSGVEKRQVECIEEIDFDRNRARIVRCDTGEQIRERAIDGDERAALAQEPLIPEGGDQTEKRV